MTSRPSPARPSRRSVASYTALGYGVVGEVPETPIGHLTMLKLPGDPFVSLELVHDPNLGEGEPGGFRHLVVAVNDVARACAPSCAPSTSTSAR